MATTILSSTSLPHFWPRHSLMVTTLQHTPPSLAYSYKYAQELRHCWHLPSSMRTTLR
ncbi:hypothetical protein BC829DRAFT_385211 [Chytridium lagenaria]|nr:hypothetical protein BC829DRAFT_385211 [Chytridium lagenaria]